MAAPERLVGELSDGQEIARAGQRGQADHIQDEAIGYAKSYRVTSSVSDLEQAIRLFENSCCLTPSTDPDKARRLQNLGFALFDKFKNTGSLSDIEAAIHNLQDALDLSSADSDDVDWARQVGNLGDTYFKKYEKTRNETDLKRSIWLTQESLKRTPAGSPDRFGRLFRLAHSYISFNGEAGSPDDIENAIRLFQESLAITSLDTVLRAQVLHNLGRAYYTKYEITDTTDNLERSVEMYRQSVDTIPKDHPFRPRPLHSLGSVYTEKYRRYGKESELDYGIQLERQALELTSADDEERGRQLHNLANAYHEKFGITKSNSDLDQSIHFHREAIDAYAWDDPDKISSYTHLGMALRDRYRIGGDTRLLEESIRLGRDSLGSTTIGRLDRTRQLEGLGIAYGLLYQTTGALQDLDLCVDFGQQSVEMTPQQHLERANRLQNLASSYGQRYRRTGAMADLDEATRYFRESLEKTPKGNIKHAARLQSVGSGYLDQYRRTGQEADIKQAIEHFQDALQATPESHLDRADRLTALACAFHTRYRKDRVLLDLEEAIRVFQSAQAYYFSREDHIDRAAMFTHLGDVYRSRYLELGMTEDLERSLQEFKNSLGITPDTHPQRASRLYSLGLTYGSMYLEYRVRLCLEKAGPVFLEALDHSPSPIQDRLRAGIAALSTFPQLNDWTQAFHAGAKTLALVPLLTPRSLENADKQHLLAEIAGLASDAAAIALKAGRSPIEAVQLLEAGRGIITGSLQELRAEISELQEEHPELAGEFNDLRDQLETGSSSPSFHVNLRYTANKRLNQLLEDVRQLPRFSRFLLGPSPNDMMAAAQSGPIVIINVSEFRCDALIIERTQIRSLYLPDLCKLNIRDRAKTLTSDLNTLDWLWRTIARPILNFLGLAKIPADSQWPRIWWIPIGPLSQFPIHAAGEISSNTPDSVLDRVVSSYGTSLKAILHGRQQQDQRRSQSPSKKVVLVAMQETPGLHNLQFAWKEAERLEELFQDMQMEVSRPVPVREDVISALKDSHIFHFAGHGHADNMDPSQSRLLLSDWKEKPLTVARMFEARFGDRKPFLAYLSACRTGRNEENELIDECLHLISAHELVGFRHVIGTLWEVDDEFCVEMALETYRWIRAHKSSDLSVSEGLHHASRHFRKLWLEKGFTEGKLREKEHRKDYGHEKLRTHRDREEGSEMKPRDIILSYELMAKPPFWVPYVHFGL